MVRYATVIVCLLALAGCGSDEDDAETPAAPATELTVKVWPKGPDGPVRERTVECPGAEVCDRLTAQRLAPVPGETACTAIYGGPSVARVTGTLDGEPVDERFSLEDGCQIERWERNTALLGPPQRGP
jgi:hypothetical protein